MVVFKRADTTSKSFQDEGHNMHATGGANPTIVSPITMVVITTWLLLWRVVVPGRVKVLFQSLV